jgi:hypothetical protein
MKKYTGLALPLMLFAGGFLFTGGSLFAQTPDLEKEAIEKRFQNEELSQLEYKDLVIAWRELTDSLTYPGVPYDPVSKKMEYVFFSSLEGIPRETIVNRVSEWAAVTFGSTDGLLTRQDNTSRLIFNGSVEVFFPDMFLVWKNSWKGYVETELQNSSICYFTMVFTIQDGRMKSQIMNLSYQYTDFISDQTVNKTLASYFPIISNDKDEWRAIFTLVDETKKSLDIMLGLLVDYIRDYENDYTW